ncbi:hypothetical protein T4C_7131 [Trichinella pseudospiralis]|uniref:Uncharacterized protein n=1 Tax=Trichinella pseudospiralis TaxID=6337 RepID=A0A0V1IT26_TRIPS|nr:hypothetical protein T4C_7131 [Trichinella pseudospiralis]
MHNHWLKRYRKLANASSHTLVFATGSNIRLQVARRSWGCGCTTIVSTTVSWCYQSNAYVQLIGRLTKWVNKKSGKGHSEFYKLLQLLVAEQGFLHILLQEVESGNALQRQIAQYMCGNTNDRRTLKQLMRTSLFGDRLVMADAFPFFSASRIAATKQQTRNIYFIKQSKAKSDDVGSMNTAFSPMPTQLPLNTTVLCISSSCPILHIVSSSLFCVAMGRSGMMHDCIMVTAKFLELEHQ